MLTEVHRQAKDRTIVRMAMTIREGGRLELGSYGQSRVVSRRTLDPAEVLECDQVLVWPQQDSAASTMPGSGNSRRPHGSMPAIGEKLVCLRNDRVKGPAQRLDLDGPGAARTAAAGSDPARRLPEDDPALRRKPTDIKAAAGDDHRLGRGDPAVPAARDGRIHLRLRADGAQGPGIAMGPVTLFDESYAFREHRARWLYTGLTRAAQAITVVV